MSLDRLGLSPEILQAIKEKGYEKSTPIQQKLIPAIFSGRDIIAGAMTGTGKTAGFALPILDILAKKSIKERHYPQAIIITPTRELAKQVYTNIEQYSKYLPLRSVVLYGGAKMTTQSKKLKAGVDIVISTTGRLLEHTKAKNILLDRVEYLVLDEADTILDMGFIDEIRQMLSFLPNKRQNILISATLSGSVKRLSTQILHRPQLIEANSMGTTASTLKQIVIPVIKELKNELLSFLIGSKNWKQVLVFVNTKHKANTLVEQLELDGLKSLAIHGDKTQGARNKALQLFKEEKIRVLVATDVVARGIDIINLPHVINFELPLKDEDYIHRIGRTGRAKQNGEALSLVCAKEAEQLKELERLVGKTLPTITTEGFSYNPTLKPSKKIKKENKEAKELAKKMMNRDKKQEKKRKTTKRDHYKSPKNKRHF